MSALTTNEPVMPLTENGATSQPMLDNKIDPSIGQAISHGNESGLPITHAGNGMTNGNAISSEGAAPLEKSSMMASSAVDPTEIPTTTTTTIITTTTGPAANGSTIASPISPTSDLSNAAPVTAGTSAAATAPNGSAISPEAAAVGGVGAGAVGGAVLADKAAGKKEEETKTVPPVSMTPKDAKKYNKLLKSEAKNEEKEIAAAIKTAQANEKALRKAKKAEAQSGSRHNGAVKDDHNTSKALNKAQLAHEKAVAALQKAEEELEIKKRHTATQSEAYESIKKKIEVLRKNKLANEKDRNSRRVNIA